MDEEIIIRRDGSVSVLGTGYYYEEELMPVQEAITLAKLAEKCDQIRQFIEAGPWWRKK